jgi:hypothetical protein
MLEDLCNVISKDCVQFETFLRYMRLVMTCFFIVQCGLAYLIRDAMLMASNYKEGRQISAYEEVRAIMAEYIEDMMRKVVNSERCLKCEMRKEGGRESYAFFEDNRCMDCRKKICSREEIVVVDNWLTNLR